MSDRPCKRFTREGELSRVRGTIFGGKVGKPEIGETNLCKLRGRALTGYVFADVTSILDVCR